LTAATESDSLAHGHVDSSLPDKQFTHPVFVVQTTEVLRIPAEIRLQSFHVDAL
jgi:hypothetical protein